MRCPKCNNWLSDFQETCEKCGEAITEEMRVIPPDWPSFKHASFMDEPVTTKEICLFTDATTETYYIEKWRNALENKSKRFGFNWAAAFFGPHWLLYRKFYLHGILLYLITMGISLFELMMIQRMARTAFQHEILRYSISFLTFLIIRIPLGFIANSMYLNKCIQTMAGAHEKSSDINQRETLIKKEGGKSVLAVALLAGFNFLLSMTSVLSTALPQLILPR